MKLAFLASLLASSAPSFASAADGAFVSVHGAHFELEGAPFVFAGANIDPLHRARSPEVLAQTLDAVVTDGMTVVRVWALGEGPAELTGWQRDQVFRAGPDGFVETTYQALDEVLVACRARKLKVMLTLVNAWPDFGGVRQYLDWAGLPADGYGASDRFYDDAQVRAHLLGHIDRLVGRTNSISGVRYAEDPTIFAWELMNESQVQSPDGAKARRAFIAEVASHIRERDPRHLVTSGVVGYGTRAERAEWRAVCELPAVSFCDSHFYPQTSDRVDDARALEQRIDDRAQLAHFVIEKPLVFGKLGLDTRKEHDGWLGQPRARMLDRFVSRLARDRVDGALLWIYQPWGGHARDYGVYVDRPDTDDVRAVMKRFAAGISRRDTLPMNPRLGAQLGDRLRYPVYQVAHGRAQIERTKTSTGTTLRIDPEHFTQGRFERLGTWDGGILPHAYGAGDGFFEWSFEGAGHAVSSVIVRARLSSELPGSDAPPDGGSIATLSIDGQLVAAFEVVSDDGRGDFVELRADDLTTVPRLAVGRHTLRISVPPGPRANGLCVYGAKGDTPGGITVELAEPTARRGL